MHLVWPSAERLPSYVAALQQGRSADNIRGVAAAEEELLEISADPAVFIAGLVDRNPVERVVTLADGSKVPRLPSCRRWLWDGEFCGVIGLRWQAGTHELPPHCLGHIGYSVVPWKKRQGYATSALRQLLPEVHAEGLQYVEVTTDPDNLASQHVILSNGGVLVEQFHRPAEMGGTPGLRYRINVRADI